MDVQLTNRRFENSIERACVACAKRRETGDDALEVRGQRFMTTGGIQDAVVF